MTAERILMGGAPEGFDARILVRELARGAAVAHVARDDNRRPRVPRSPRPGRSPCPPGGRRSRHPGGGGRRRGEAMAHRLEPGMPDRRHPELFGDLALEELDLRAGRGDRREAPALHPRGSHRELGTRVVGEEQVEPGPVALRDTEVGDGAQAVLDRLDQRRAELRRRELGDRRARQRGSRPEPHEWGRRAHRPTSSALAASAMRSRTGSGRCRPKSRTRASITSAGATVAKRSR